MTMTRDAIVGYWPADPESLRVPVAPDSLGYLTENRRIQIMLGSLAGMFRVVGKPNGASVLADRTVIFTTVRPTNALLESQTALVANYAELRVDRNAEIMAQAAEILPFFGSLAAIGSPSKAHTYQVLCAVQWLCVLLEMQVKHLCWAPRPMDFAPEIFPCVPTPDHSSFPSGHATEAFALAAVLHRLMTGEAAQPGVGKWTLPFRLAHRIAVNRTIAGVHFPVDSAAGAVLGCAIADAVAAMGQGGTLPEATFAPSGFEGDFTVAWVKGAIASAGAVLQQDVALFADVWKAAQREWKRPSA